tara:strand:+ start:348 stop:941 length:594 start_codon:yes stop_codon:yes gene_type:complete
MRYTNEHMEETTQEVGGVQLQGRFVVPGVVVTHFHIREGDTVADFGAGSGYFLETLACLVGQEGVVYACEIQKDLVEKMGNIARSKGLAQVNPLWGDLEELGGTKVPEGVLDVAMLVNTFFQIEDKQTALQEVLRTTRPGGKFFLVDWSESFAGLGPHADAVVTEQMAKDYCEQEGFVFERSFDAGDHHYGLAFRKV